MRIYTEQPDNPVNTGNEAMDELSQKYLDLKMECFKFQLMWWLRSIENEINSSRGHLKITKEGEIEINGFSVFLTAKIRELLSSKD